MFRSLFRHIKDGFKGVIRHFGMAFSSASAITITLLLVGVFTMVAINISYLSKEIEDNLTLVALIDYDVTDKNLINNLQKEIEKVNGVENVVYRTKDEEFDFYVENYPQMSEFSELYRADNPFHDTFIIYINNDAPLSNIKASVSKLSGINEVEDGGSNTYTLISILQATRSGGIILIASLLLLAIYLIYNTIKITIASRKDEIWIMRNVGAKNSYIRAPFLVEGIIIGFLGSLIPIILVVFLYYRLFEMTGGVLAGVLILIPVYPFILYLALALLFIGIMVGFIGSYISVCKYLRLTR